MAGIISIVLACTIRPVAAGVSLATSYWFAANSAAFYNPKHD
jgi:hypothetical protein